MRALAVASHVNDLQWWGLLRSSPGTGAAIVVPLGLTLLTSAFPAGLRGSVVGIWGRIAGLAVAAGTLIGGACRARPRTGRCLAQHGQAGQRGRHRQSAQQAVGGDGGDGGGQRRPAGACKS
jgi:hypothetical protein